MTDKIKKFGITISTILGSLVLGASAFAAADPEITNAASTTATTMKENVVSAVTTALPIVIVAGVLILSVLVVWRLGKRFVSGR